MCTKGLVPHNAKFIMRGNYRCMVQSCDARKVLMRDVCTRKWDVKKIQRF
jgi:hypothetical protein